VKFCPNIFTKRSAAFNKVDAGQPVLIRAGCGEASNLQVGDILTAVTERTIRSLSCLLHAALWRLLADGRSAVKVTEIRSGSEGG